MDKINNFEDLIFKVEKIRVILEGDNIEIISKYDRTAADGEMTLSDLILIKIKSCISGGKVVGYTGIGRVANGNFKLKNLRETYDFFEIKKAHTDVVNFFISCDDEHQKDIKSLKKKIRLLNKKIKKTDAEFADSQIDDDVLDPYEILQIDPSASDEEVKTAYKSKINRMHPDRIDFMDESIKVFAVEKAKEINTAYAAIQEERNMPG